MLRVSTWTTIQSHNRPAVGQNLCFSSAQIDHGLDCKNIPGTNLGPLAWLSVIGNLWILVHFATDSVPNILTYDRVTMILGMLLHRPANVTQMQARAAMFNRALQAFFCHPDQLQQLRSDITHRHRRCRIADKAIQRDTYVDGKDVTALEFVTRRKAVHHLLVN